MQAWKLFRPLLTGSVGYLKMDQENKKNIVSRIIYWTTSTIIIISLFLVFFGVLPVLMDRTNVNAISVIGFIISGIGLIIILISLYSYLSFTKQVIKINPDIKLRYHQRANSVVLGLIGLSLLLGGLLYIFTENSTYLVLSFVTPVLLLSIFNKIMGRNA